MRLPEARRGEESSLKLLTFHGAFHEGYPHGFTGHAIIDERTGQFVGYTDDIYGEADIKGEMKNGRIKFTKVYRDKKLNDFPITYEFNRSTDGRHEFWNGAFKYGPSHHHLDYGESEIRSLSITRSAATPDQFLELSGSLDRLIEERRAEIEERWKDFPKD